jgi:hypothetical protein
MSPTDLDNYESYQGLPELAGVCTMKQAMSPGLSLDECVGRLKRLHYALKRLHQLLTSRITAEPIYELKTALSHHAHLCAEHVGAIRKRVGEMREPPLGLNVVPDENLEFLFDEILASPSTEELVTGVYEIALPAIRVGLRRHVADTHPLADAPSVRVCRFALIEVDDMLAFGEQAVVCLVDDQARHGMEKWLTLLHNALAAAGAIDGVDTPSGESIERQYSAKPYRYDGVPRRDERFIDPYNAGVNPEAFLYDEEMPANAKTIMMYYKRLRELDVPEMMSSIITETPDKPWDYYQEMTRQLWDEARHSLMGEIGFASLGIDWRQIPFTFTWSLNLNTQLEPWQRHAVLFFIEQGLMPKTGKRYEYEVGVESGEPLSRLIQDYDWADEVLHAAIGRRWYVSQFGGLDEAMRYGDECWSSIMSDWRKYQQDGLTEHRNWWPEIYRRACEHWDISPNERVLAFNETYENIRADLKEISASG